MRRPARSFGPGPACGSLRGPARGTGRTPHAGYFVISSGPLARKPPVWLTKLTVVPAATGCAPPRNENAPAASTVA